jgi:hypothetical protein
MEAASRAPLEPLSEAGPEMPSAPSSAPRSAGGARPEALQPLNEPADLDLSPLVGDDLSLALLDPDTVPMAPPAPTKPTAAPPSGPASSGPASSAAASSAPARADSLASSPPLSLSDPLAEPLPERLADPLIDPLTDPLMGSLSDDSLSLAPPPPPPAAPAPKSESTPVKSSASAAPSKPVSIAAKAAAKAPARDKLSLPTPPPKGRADISAAPAPVPAPAAPASVAALPANAAPAAKVEVPTPAMDRDFIARNQIVERYISGRLPLKGATDFEKFCTENPQLLDELGLPERVNAGLRLLEAAGKPEPWQEAPRKIWEKPQLAIGLGVATLALAITLAVVWSGSSQKSARITKLEKVVAEQPLEPATQTRTVRVLPSFKGGSNSAAVVIGGGTTQLADLKLDLSRSGYRNFRITIDRIDQGRVAILHYLTKDSNGHVRIALNTSALGPGNYQFTIEGVSWRGEVIPDAWVTIAIAR